MKDVYDSPAVQKMESVLRAAERANRIELSSEEAESIRDMCNHSRSSYAEEHTAQTLDDFLERYEEDQKAQAKENRINRIVSGISIAIALLSLITSWLK